MPLQELAYGGGKHSLFENLINTLCEQNAAYCSVKGRDVAYIVRNKYRPKCQKIRF
jgi:hypothetical protein